MLTKLKQEKTCHYFVDITFQFIGNLNFLRDMDHQKRS